MKANEILKWIVKESINGENINLIDVPEEGDECGQQNEEWWINQFGMYPPYPIPQGRYMYYYTSQIPFGQLEEPDATIELPMERWWDYIHLYKVED